MAQQAPFKKLKEQIQAAKRDLTEMSNVEITNSPSNLPLAGSTQDFVPSALPKNVVSEAIKTNTDDIPHSNPSITPVVDMISKTVLSDTLIADHTSTNSADSLDNEFQFFHRERKTMGGGPPPDVSTEKAGKAEPEVLLHERLGRRLATLEEGVEENRKYVLELINLLSQLDLRRETEYKKMKSLQRFNRRHMFWLVIGFLAVGWFGLTPSGHKAVQHFLAFL